MKYYVQVEKTMKCFGIIEVEARSCTDAVKKVQKGIDQDVTRTVDALWDEPEYDDFSFGTTGNVR